jgi:hypothetical protein
VVLSEEVRLTAGLADDVLPRQEVAIRGRAEPMTVRIAVAARQLSALAEATDNGEAVGPGATDRADRAAATPPI